MFEQTREQKSVFEAIGSWILSFALLYFYHFSVIEEIIWRYKKNCGGLWPHIYPKTNYEICVVSVTIVVQIKKSP